MLQGRNNNHIKERQGGFIPGRAPVRNAKFGGFDVLGEPGTENTQTMLGFCRKNDMPYGQFSWDEK